MRYFVCDALAEIYKTLSVSFSYNSQIKKGGVS